MVRIEHSTSLLWRSLMFFFQFFSIFCSHYFSILAGGVIPLIVINDLTFPRNDFVSFLSDCDNIHITDSLGRSVWIDCLIHLRDEMTLHRYRHKSIQSSKSANCFCVTKSRSQNVTSLLRHAPLPIAFSSPLLFSHFRWKHISFRFLQLIPLPKPSSYTLPFAFSLSLSFVEFGLTHLRVSRHWKGGRSECIFVKIIWPFARWKTSARKCLYFEMW